MPGSWTMIRTSCSPAFGISSATGNSSRGKGAPEGPPESFHTPAKARSRSATAGPRTPTDVSR